MNDGKMRNTSDGGLTAIDLDLFLNLFQGREGVFARQWPDGEAYSPLRPERSIDANDILSHIKGGETYGIYPITKDNTVKLVCFDVDLPKNFAELEEDTLVTDKSSLLPQVQDIYTTAVNALHRYNFNSRSILIEDTGGRGYHLWVFFESLVPAVNARKFAYYVLAKANVQCEVFPKQDEVGEQQYGNLIKLPLGLHRKYKRYSNFIDIRDERTSNIEDPFAFLTEITPVPVSIILDLSQGRVREKGPKHIRSRGEIKLDEVTRREITGETAIRPGVGHLVEKCRAFSNLKNKAVSQRHLEHTERLALAYVLINAEGGEQVLHKILSNCSDYDRDRTRKEIDYLRARGMKPISCPRLKEQGICDKYCRSEIREQLKNPNRPEPSPIRFALWRSLDELESVCKTDILRFENVYRKSNLYRAWEQVRNYARQNEAFVDMHAFGDFEEHLEVNIETLRFELRNHTYLPGPYRSYLIPKERKADDFEYRRMAFVHPRDYVVMQAIINVIGPTFEKSFSGSSCLGYRLDTKGKTGNSIFYSWQSAWESRKERVTSFLYHPEYFYYIKADISRFYDCIDRVRLYELILEKIGSVTETCQIIKNFLENTYIDDSNGEEKTCSPPSKGIPQGPAFSAFFANIYLDELDHLIEKRSSDYVRYVDDMVILCEGKRQMDDTKKFLEDYLASLNLELNAEKTTDPCPVTNSEPLLDFLGEMKYGMAGLFARQSYGAQLMPPEFLKTKLDGLLNIRELNIYDLEEIAKHLSFYLRMRERIEPRLNDLAIGLSQEVLKAYALKPHHLVIVLDVLIRNQVDLSKLIPKCQYPYAKIVLCLVLATLEEAPHWAESLLSGFIEDASSYILRGTACWVLSKLNRWKYRDTVLDAILREASPYVIDRSLNCLVAMKSDEAKMCFLQLAKRHFRVSLNQMIGATIKWGDSMLDRLVKKQTRKIDAVSIADLYIILEFIFTMCPDDFEELLLTFFSKDKAVLMHHLLSSSMDEIKKMAGKRGYLALDHQRAIHDRVKDVKSDWPRTTLLESIEEWRIGMAELGPSTALSDVNYWLTDGDTSKEYQFMQNLSCKEHLRQGGYQSWLVKDKKANKYFVVEAVEEDILKEHKVIGNGVTKEDIKDQLDSNKLSTLSDCFHNVEGGRKYCWFRYVIPEGYDILCNVYNGQKEKAKLDEQEVLNIVSSLFNQVELIKQHIGVEPVVNPYTVILGEGNQVRIVNLFFGIPRKLYASTLKRSTVDVSTTTNALFNGLLSYELISSKCPIEIYERLRSGIDQTPRLVSDYLPDVARSLHFAWILDRLCYPTSPDNRYTSLSTLKKDIACFQQFTRHFQSKELLDLPANKKYWSAVLDVLNLRVARFLGLPYKIHDSIHENVIRIFSLTVHCLAKALDNTHSSTSTCFNWRSSSPVLRKGLTNDLHEAGYRCDLFATGIRQKILSISKITGWPLAQSIPLMILYIPLKLELVALARAMGLFEIHNKEAIKNAIVRLMQPQDLLRESIKGVSLRTFVTTSRATKLADLVNLFGKKEFQHIINADGSDIALLMLVTLVLLENSRELWKEWSTCMGLSDRTDLNKAVSRLKYITENSMEIDGIAAKFCTTPLERTFEEVNTLISLYNSCLQDIVKLRKIMRIRRRRTFVVQDFHHLERDIVVSLGRKEEKASHDLIIPFPPCYQTIFRKESITVDTVGSRKNKRIVSLSLTPTMLKKMVGWEYQSLFAIAWSWARTHSRGFLWRITASGLSLGGILLIFKYPRIGTILLAFGCLLLGPLVEELYSKRRRPEE